MTLRSFLEHSAKTKQLPQGNVFCFSGKSYPLLFFYYLLSFFKKNGYPIESINCDEVEIASLKSLLSMMGFAGATIYYLERFNALPIKKQQEMLDYLKLYAGPHRVILFIDNESSYATLSPRLQSAGKATADRPLLMHIELPDHMAPRDFFQVRFLLADNAQEKSTFASELVMRTDQLSLDSACLFAQYEVLVGNNPEDFFSQWMVYLTEPTTSLFALSQHFLSKKSKSFFRQWSTISDLYMPTFWVAFWADQCWRAYVYADLMKQKKQAEAKKAQYKLPFSFINRDWQMYSLDELRNAHNCLAKIDFQLKNGASDIGLEYFYTQFFDQKFRINQN